MQPLNRNLSPLGKQTERRASGAIDLFLVMPMKRMKLRRLIPQFTGSSSFFSVLLGGSDFEANLIWEQQLKRVGMGLWGKKYA